MVITLDQKSQHIITWKVKFAGDDLVAVYLQETQGRLQGPTNSTAYLYHRHLGYTPSLSPPFIPVIIPYSLYPYSSPLSYSFTVPYPYSPPSTTCHHPLPFFFSTILPLHCPLPLFSTFHLLSSSPTLILLH
ncbi:hypothetical protein Pcinc_010380 [Petrolisthes cinctipes]|uniref:Uncharacterized protein n=1 Tax=Petrolisthes cinctipes TaxID=88211 RepID=A0AAE1KTM7_PETCI|nr:hypothetical protein Pcinc_010380 [Petrolisthes cinctipes]